MSSRLRTLTRRNAVFAILAVALALILVLRPDAVTSVDRDDLPLVFDGFEPDQIRRIEISRTTPDGPERIELKLGGGGSSWLLSSHFQYPTQAGAARLLDAIAAARSRGDVTRRQETFDRYAGDDGWTEVTLTDLQGKEALAFGIGSYVYPETFLRIGTGDDARVVKAINLAPGVARTEVRSWIETRLWPDLSATNAVRIDVEQRPDERTITLVKRGEPEADVGMAVPPAPEDGSDEGGTWWMATPTPGEGRTLAVEDLLRQFTGVLIEDIVAGDLVGDAAATYGLDDPELVATLHHKVDGTVTPHTLIVGGRVEGADRWYVQRKGARWVFVVGASSLARMRQMPAEFRVPEPAEDEPAEDEPAKDEPAKDEPAQDEPAKDEPAKGEPAKDEPAKDEPAKDEPAKDEPAKDAPAKDEPAKDG